MKASSRILLLSIWAIVLPALCVSAPRSQPLQAERAAADESAVYKKLLALRADFIRRIRYEGFEPSLPAPKIEMEDPPTFGNYDAATNILHIAIWSKLTEEEKQFFEGIAKQLGPRASARGVFENGTDRWVFTHELSHWWQDCQKQTRANSYEEEMGANRIAAAYWRGRDPDFMDGMIRGFRGLRASIPDPVPPGESKIEFLDTHFAAVSVTDGYTWYQSDMVIDASEENPLPSFLRALSQPLYPW